MREIRHRFATWFFVEARQHTDTLLGAVFSLLDQVAIGVQGRFDVPMPHQCLNTLQVHPAFNQHGRIEVPQGVGRVCWLFFCLGSALDKLDQTGFSTRNRKRAVTPIIDALPVPGCRWENQVMTVIGTVLFNIFRDHIVDVWA
ncbi:hypothetical protein TH25_21210 [Thalassospira profundimaris]|uniref:Uncharacterized protein n=1 Tax=Thalassospira profundimaris TaxID=502049 RepID=A0A367WR40_9PROT|nr:hypothetical protein TH25_21210 [Thalassospira profundimaris]